MAAEPLEQWTHVTAAVTNNNGKLSKLTGMVFLHFPHSASSQGDMEGYGRHE